MMGGAATEIAIVGAGIGGLALALELHQRGIASRVYESAPELKELGVGITILPHAMRELTALGLQDKIVAGGVANTQSAFFNRFGQLLYHEPRGTYAGYAYPEVGIHRGRLHTALYDAAKERLGTENILTNRRCVGVEQDARGVTLLCQETTSGAALPPVRTAIVLACDGINSAVRRQFYPNEELAFEGINTWRGVARSKPILDGHTYIRIGSIKTGKLVIYPISPTMSTARERSSSILRAKRRSLADRRTIGTSLRNWKISCRSMNPGASIGSTCRNSCEIRKSYWNIRWSTVTRSNAGRSAASRSWATPRIRCISGAPTVPPRH